MFVHAFMIAYYFCSGVGEGKLAFTRYPLQIELGMFFAKLFGCSWYCSLAFFVVVGAKWPGSMRACRDTAFENTLAKEIFTKVLCASLFDLAALEEGPSKVWLALLIYLCRGDSSAD